MGQNWKNETVWEISTRVFPLPETRHSQLMGQILTKWGKMESAQIGWRKCGKAGKTVAKIKNSEISKMLHSWENGRRILDSCRKKCDKIRKCPKMEKWSKSGETVTGKEFDADSAPTESTRKISEKTRFRQAKKI